MINQMKQLLLCILAFSAFSFDVSYQVDSRCSGFSPEGLCKSWKHSGFATQQESCFPENMIVNTKRGYITFKELRTGDMLLGIKDGVQTYSAVRGWLHRDPNIVAPYLQIHNEDHYIAVSHKHSVALEDGRYAFAEESIGYALFGHAQPFNHITTGNEQGKYAPLTINHNYFVYFQKDGASILVHDFAHIFNPTQFENVVDFVVSAWDIFGQVGQVAHPAVIWMRYFFAFLVQ